MYMEGLDEKDYKILQVIEKDARLEYTEIGKRVGLSRVAVKQRMEKLEKRGVIKGYYTLIDQGAIAKEGIQFFADIETEPEYYEDVVERLSYEKRVRQIYSTTGMSKIHIEGFASTKEDVAVFSRSIFRNAKGIKKLEWNIVASVLKDVDGGVEYVRYKEPEYMEGRQQEFAGANQE